MLALTIAVAQGQAEGQAQAPGPFDIGALTTLLGQTRAGEATFTERREVAMLDRTLESSGHLSFEAPDTFVRETLKPRQERLAVTGNTLTMSRGQRSRSVALDSVPEAGVFVEAVRGTLSGNRAVLERLFVASVAGSAERWTLELVPREARLAQQVASIRIAGEAAQVREIRLAMPDGDRSVMTITAAVQPAMTIAPAGQSAMTVAPAVPPTTTIAPGGRPAAASAAR